THHKQPIPRTRARDVEQLTVRRENIFELNHISDCFEPRSEWQQILVALSDGDGVELEPFRQLHDAEPPGARRHLLGHRKRSGFFAGRSAGISCATDQVAAPHEYRDLLRQNTVIACGAYEPCC